MNEVKEHWNILPEDEQTEIARRRLICAGCPFNSVNAVNDGYTSNRIDEHCTMCGCTITRKTASLTSSCGIGCCNKDNKDECSCKKPSLQQYNITNNINMPLKWEAYKKPDNEQQTTDSN